MMMMIVMALLKQSVQGHWTLIKEVKNDDDDAGEKVKLDKDGLPAYSHQVGICHNDKEWEYDTVTIPPCINPPSIHDDNFEEKCSVLSSPNSGGCCLSFSAPTKLPQCSCLRFASARRGRSSRTSVAFAQSEHQFLARYNRF